MLTKLPLLICLTAYSGFCQAQEALSPIELIELLGEFDEDETATLEEAISDIESPKLPSKQPMQDAEAPYNGPTREHSTQ